MYGKLMFTGKAFIGSNSRRYIECICECGSISFQMFNRVVRGETVSCGCKRKPHGKAVRSAMHPIYRAWINIKERCHNINGRDYPEYGGRCIKVCDEWKYDFNSFYEWSNSNGWKKGLSLDRYPNNETGNYEPSNCRWATQAQQNRNKRNNKYLTAFGETKCIADWILDNRCGAFDHKILSNRINNGWGVELAITFSSVGNKLNGRKRVDNRLIVYKNETKSIGEFCNDLGMPYKLVWNRLRDGWGIEKALETPINKNKSNKKWI